ncbi:hypothetical protein SCHPADRAFT_514933 [Schizopora paradoxa]|uniref:Uncharacterized protein n=1 Tax=Schizopora paradoxa TaxID=27342 RepID=A0A0H2RFD7_9AGAM|nr:hypothetical protein SCHPADRAFT_514933 [Schizopora paradoxa]
MMGDNDYSPSIIQLTPGSSIPDGGIPGESPSPTSLIDDFRRDDATYSYASTWSTNYTTSNLVGAGRILGNLYSRAGSSLEKRLGRIAYRAGIGSQAQTVAKLQNNFHGTFNTADTNAHEEFCELLLTTANFI